MKIPLFPLDFVLFPGASLPLHIFEERYKEMIGECIETESIFGIVRAQPGGLSITGCTARIVRLLDRYEDGRMDILCEGQRRFEIESLDPSGRSFLQAEIDWLEDSGPVAQRAEREQCVALHFEVMELAGMGAGQMSFDLDHPIGFRLAASIPAEPGFQQQLLASTSDAERTLLLIQFYELLLPQLREMAASANPGDAAPRHEGPVN